MGRVILSKVTPVLVTCLLIYLSIHVSQIGLIYLLLYLIQLVFWIFNGKSRDKIILFSFTILIGLIQSISNDSYISEYNTTFYYPDQLDSFYARALYLADSNFIADMFHRALVEREFLTLSFPILIMSLPIYIEQTLFNTSSFISISLLIVFISAYIIQIVYKFLFAYLLDNLKALKYSLFYASCTTFTLYLSYVLRDQFISLIYLMFFILLINNRLKNKYTYLLLLVLLAFEFRVLNGLFLGFILILFMLQDFIKSQRKRIYATLIVTLFCGFLLLKFGAIVSFIDKLLYKQQEYISITNNVVDSVNGLSVYLYRLPPILKEFSIIVFSQVSFPYWDTYDVVNSFSSAILFLFRMIGRLGWFYVFYYLVTHYKSVILILKYNKNLKQLFLFFVFFLIINTANLTDRRLMCFYIIPFTVFCLIFNSKSKYSKIKNGLNFLFLNVVLFMIYIFVKLI